MIEVKLSFSSVDEAVAFLSRDAAQPEAAQRATDAPLAPEVEKPKRRTRKSVEGGTAVTAEPTGATAVEQPPVAESLFAASPAPTVQVNAPKVDQKVLIQTFRVLANTLGKDKGTEAFMKILADYKAPTIAQIPEKLWGEACQKARAVIGLNDEQFAEAVKALATAK